MAKKIIIWVLIVLLLLGGGGTLYYLFSIGAIGFELPVTTEPAKADLIALYTEPPTEPKASEPEVTEPAPTEPAATEPAPSEPSDEQEDPAPQEEEKPKLDLNAEHYFVYDLREKEFLVLSGRQATRIYPASVTKLMTSYVALQHFSPEDTIKVGSEIKLISWDSSRANLHVGDVLTVAQCIDAMLLPSGNDAAYTMAVNVARKISDEPLSNEAALKVFLKEMNRVAKDIGMNNSHFATVDGMHLADHYTCAADLATLVDAILEHPAILNSASTRKQTITVGSHTYSWTNTNFLLNENSKYYIPYAMGMKTGFTSYAGNCLLSLFFADDRLYLVGTFDSPTKLGRFADTNKLYELYCKDN